MNIPISPKAQTAGQDFWKSGDYTYRSNFPMVTKKNSVYLQYRVYPKKVTV